MKNLEEFERNLGYKFKKSELLEEALTHKSTKQALNNERLEFLGDAVMDLLVAEYLFKKFSKIAEGDMSKLRAALVNEKSFAIRRSTLRTLKRTTKQPFKRSLKQPLASYQHTSS